MARTKDEATKTTTEETAPRRRGRPSAGTPKAAGVKKAYVPTGRPRGRPKSDNPKTSTYVPTGRPRGRPPGSGKKKGTKAVQDKAAPEPESASKPKATSGPGKRGRPRKSDAAAETPKIKGKRGRPSKKPLVGLPIVKADDDAEPPSDVEPPSDADDGAVRIDDTAGRDSLDTESGEESEPLE